MQTDVPPQFIMLKNTKHNSESFLVLITGAQRVLHAFILKLVLNLSDADDILQETNIVLWAKQDEFTPGTDFRAWAFRIARYQVMAYRKRQSLDRLVFGDQLFDRLADFAESRCDLLDEKREMLVSCIEQLNDLQRQLLSEHYGRQLSGRQIAEKTGRKVDAVFQSLHRMRKSLMQCIEQRLAERREASDR